MRRLHWLYRGLALVLVFLLSAVTLWPVRVAGSVQPLFDIRGHWAEQDIRLLVSHGIVDGYPDGTFNPSRKVTRAEFAKILVKAMNREEDVWALADVPSAFPDVAPTHWAKPYIQLAYEMGIIKGFDDGNFYPARYVRRAEIAVMLARALRYNVDRENTAPLPFTDAATIPAWARDAVVLGTQRYLIGGFPDGTFRPFDHTTRAEASVMIARLLSERGGRYDYYGTVTEVTSQTMTLRLDNSLHVFRYVPGLPIFQAGLPVDWQDFLNRLPATVYVNVDGSGQISYLQLALFPVANPITLSYDGGQLSAEIPDSRLLGAQPFTALSGRLGETASLTLPDPGKSLNITREEIGAGKLSALTRADGRGQLIAIIDTGVDPSHPDLQFTTSYSRKIRDYIDLTTEGRVVTPGIVPANRDTHDLDGFRYTFGQIPSKSGYLRYGYLDEQALGMDIDFNGRDRDRFLVVLADPFVAGQYEMVYLDSDGDRNLNNQIPLRAYHQEPRVVNFPQGPLGQSFGLVVSRISADGSAVIFGFDANGHGTQVAGIAAANGKLQGIAPGAELLVIKALNSRGETDWRALSDAIKLAVAARATIINLSLGNYQDGTGGQNALTQLIDEYSQAGVVFTVAVGNKGPGISTLATPGNSRHAISVGAYISPRMWEQDYGYSVPRDSLWYFSSVGPRLDGLMAPHVVAPGSATTTNPGWTGQSYVLVEGTSAAAPHVAGGVALLLDSARRAGTTYTPAAVRNALVNGARVIDHFSPAEAGHGAVDLAAAWENLRRLSAPPNFVGYTYNRLLGLGEGMYAREFLPGQMSYRLHNRTGWPVQLYWRSTVDWMEPELSGTLLPPGLMRHLPVIYRPPQKPGLYAGFLEGDAPGTPGIDMRLMATLIRPYPLTAANNHTQVIDDALEAAQYRRYYFRVPDRTSRFNVNLSVLNDQGGGYQGRVRMHIVRPDGTEYQLSDYAGVGPPGTIQRGQVGVSVPNPQPGTWEVVVYSSAALSLYGQQTSRYRLEAGLTGVVPPSGPAEPRWLIGVVPKLLVPGQQTYITLQVRHRDTKEPVSGMMEIDGLLYEVRSGKVTIPVTPAADRIQLKIRTN